MQGLLQPTDEKRQIKGLFVTMIFSEVPAHSVGKPLQKVSFSKLTRNTIFLKFIAVDTSNIAYFLSTAFDKFAPCSSTCYLPFNFLPLK